jgi:predicted RNA binding protein YcfA (HicA-like mRNA interferase family)
VVWHQSGKGTSRSAAIGWTIVSQRGSHAKLKHPQLGSYTFAFHDKEEIGPKMLARIAKHTGLTPEDI